MASRIVTFFQRFSVLCGLAGLGGGLIASGVPRDDARASDSDILPGPDGSFPWSPAPALPTLHGTRRGDPSAIKGVPIGGSFPWSAAPAPQTLHDPSKPISEPGGRFGSVASQRGTRR